MTPAETITARRIEAGLSIRALARLTGFDATQISRWEHGRVTPGMLCAARLARALGGVWQDYTKPRG